ncbi:PhnD/SsuA/transferrin family substrate-binding protein [Methanospirillum hungatei]|uniref:PhnD/SsuA/transferrin family substrate-binding protein n=1 Tax=Methanospirillum hungatei TaxID=2203 RepID=UPI0026EDB255|nr:PhnD/SsuA/transferrin family substrate-binding protein [Methanospirillum hungatei]MCA1917184.1 PhnD/SsuA/transferrin family substrate-binding protein [Methanospirillum hungatei]
MNRIHRTVYYGIIFCLLFTGLISGPGMAFVPSPENPVTIGEQDELLTATTHPVNIGVLANRGYDIAMQEWGPTADYLNKTLAPVQFTIIPLDFHEINDAVLAHNISFLSANPSVYTYLEYYGLAQRIATLQVPGDPDPQPVFGGVIFTRSDRNDITDLEDLKGKKFAAVDKTSLGGWHAAWAELKEGGINPEKDFKSLNFTGTHDASVFSVLSGDADAGTVRSSQLERMEKEGKINLSDITVLNSQKAQYPHYPYLLSTPLYPEWPFASITGTDPDLSKDVAVALLNMEEDDPAAKAVRGAGWAVPQDHTKVHEMLRSLQFPPYDQYGKPTIEEVLNQYWQTILAVILGIILLLALLISTLRTKERLKESKAELMQAHEELAQSQEKILDSLYYAELIQQSILPSKEEMNQHLCEYFTIIKPRDIVGGDYYLLKKAPDGFFIAVADCTGHGVPGALMTMMTSTLLTQILAANPDDTPASILAKLHHLVQQILKAQSEKKHLENGLDMALCKVNTHRQEILFAGGGLPLIIADETGVREIAGDRLHLGFSQEKKSIVFTDHQIPITPGSRYYLITDGILDLPGGQHGHGYGRKRLLALLVRLAHLPMAQQRELVIQELASYQGTWTAKDDMTMIGFRIT